MRKIREVLRLKYDHQQSDRRIALSCQLSRSTVKDYQDRFQRSGLDWPLPPELSDKELEQQLFPSCAKTTEPTVYPDWAEIHQQLRRKGVTRWLLWQEYKSQHPNGIQYSQFCVHYRRWLEQLDPVMRQHHTPGEKLFVDYAGQTVAITDPESGQTQSAQIFVAVLGASNYTYVEATWSQQLSDWLMSHVRTFEFLGGCPESVVPDNLKSAVSQACYYEPELNPSYAELAQHYQIAVLPARSRKPRDKAKVEVGVQIVERQLLAPLRHHTFFSLSELNQSLRPLLTQLNQQPFQQQPGSRQQRFEQEERAQLKPLPARPYQFAQWRKVRVGRDYHVLIEQSYYSVPHALIGKQLEARISEHIVELFHRGQRVASHQRLQPAQVSTVNEHRPPAHQYYADISAEQLLHWAQQTGAATTELVQQVLFSGTHLQQGCRVGAGLQRLAKHYGPTRLEAAAQRALRLGTHSYKSIESILAHGLDQQPLPTANDLSLPEHSNLRGSAYYH